jgi:serine/threonine-protein kinase
VLGALFPVWAIVFPIWFSLLALLLLKIPGALPPLTAGIMLGILFFVPLLALVSTAFAEDDQILISKDGLAFPLLFLAGLGFRREFPWSDLGAIHLHWAGESEFGPKDCLDLFFQHGGHARLKLNKLSASDLEQLVLALTLWAGQRGDEQLLFELQTHLRGGEAKQRRLSITELWEEELASRFRVASFSPLESGTSLQSGRMKIVKQLGFGGYSATYLGQRHGRDLVVLKEAVNHRSGDQSASPAVDQLMQEEASLLLQIKHPKIARLLDHFVEKGRRYLVIQYIPGQDLRQLVRENGPQLESRVVEWATSLCDILDYLHSRNPPIIHLDITPENLLLKRDGEIALIDFGLAMTGASDKTSLLSGKTSYLAPEQIKLKPVVQSDIFAFGCTLYYLLTGQDPTPVAPASPRSLRPAISAKLDLLINQCTALSLSERIPSVQILKQNLEDLSQSQGKLTAT